MNKQILLSKTEKLMDIVQKRRSELNAKVLKTFLSIALPGSAIVFGLVYNAQKIGDYLFFSQEDYESGIIQENDILIYIAAIFFTIIAAAILSFSMLKIIRQAEGMLTEDDIKDHVSNILSEISQAPSFKRNALIPKEIFSTTGFLKNTDCLYYGNNLIEIPAYRSMQVRLCNLHALQHNPHLNRIENENRVINRNPVGVYFDGILVHITLNKTTQGKAMIIPEVRKSNTTPVLLANFINKNFSGNQPDYKSQFPHQKSVLDGQYTVYCSELDAASEIITERFIERADRLHHAITAVKPTHKDVPLDMAQAIGIDVAQLKISIVENNLFLAIGRARLFELSVRKSYNETKQDIEESIRYYKAIVDFCNEIDA